MAKTTVAKKPTITTYTKEQLLRCKRYINRRDLLGALLTDGARYSFKEVDALLDKYMKGKVN